MNEGTGDYQSLMDSDIGNLTRNAIRVATRYPRSVIPFLRMALYQKKAASLRAAYRAKGLEVPAFLIASVTRRCNLKCVGCYSHVAAGLESTAGRAAELDAANLERVIGEAAGLGVSFVLMAGGEPLVRAEDIFRIASRHPRVAFPVFTNGTLIDEGMIARLRRLRNVIPILSVEGGHAATDSRRGKGTFETVSGRMRELKKKGIFFGVSFTVMSHNLAELIDPAFVKSVVDSGAGILFYNEYTPVEPGTESLCVSRDGRLGMLADLKALRRRFPALMLAFPGDEDRYGGCLSAGRGFVHVAPDGRLEACPFAPFGDSSAADRPFAEALASPLLAAIRANHGELAETAGGCALWNRRDWAEGLAGERARD